VSDIKLSNHGAVIDFDCQNTIVDDGSTFRKAFIDGGNFEQFQEAMSSDLMEFNEVFRDEGTSCSRINNSCGFDSIIVLMLGFRVWTVEAAVLARVMSDGGIWNHISVGMKRPYLHELSIDHLHYGVI